MACKEVSSKGFSVGRVFWRLFVLIHLIQPLCWAAGPSCYRLDRAYSPDDAPCNPSATESTCCGDGWACLDNGLCLSTIDSPRIKPNIFSQGSCTDASWKSNKCANPCNGERRSPHGHYMKSYSDQSLPAAVGLTPCGGNDYCCGVCNCLKNETFNIPGKPSAFTTIGIAALLSKTTVASASSSSISSASSLSSSQTLATTSSVAAASSASSLDPSGLLASVSSSPSSSPSPSAQPDSDSDANKSTKVGLGVGIPLAAALVAVVALFIWRERHWRKRMQNAQAAPVAPAWGSANNPNQAHELPQKRVLHEMGTEDGMTELPSSR